MRLDQLQTMKIAFDQIKEGEEPWIALGNFMNHWYEYSKDQRPALIAEQLSEHDLNNEYLHRWAVFCAASVEWFCHKYGEICPDWAKDPKYILTSPWFDYSE